MCLFCVRVIATMLERTQKSIMISKCIFIDLSEGVALTWKRGGGLRGAKVREDLWKAWKCTGNHGKSVEFEQDLESFIESR
jgi:hypothetical protein